MEPAVAISNMYNILNEADRQKSGKKGLKEGNVTADAAAEKTVADARQVQLNKRKAIISFFSKSYSQLELVDLMDFNNGLNSMYGFKDIRSTSQFAKNIALAYIPDSNNSKSLPEEKTPFQCARVKNATEFEVTSKPNVRDFFPNIKDLEIVLVDNVLHQMFVRTASAETTTYLEAKARLQSDSSSSSSHLSLKLPVPLSVDNTASKIVEKATDIHGEFEDRKVSGVEIINGERWKLQKDIDDKNLNLKVESGQVLAVDRFSSKNRNLVIVLKDVSIGIATSFTIDISFFKKPEASTPEEACKSPPEAMRG